MDGVTMISNRKFVYALASVALATSLSVATPFFTSGASAKSAVSVGGHADCPAYAWPPKLFAALVTVTLDKTGESHTVQTGFNNDVYRMTFSIIPGGQSGATLSVFCSQASPSPGWHSKHITLKVDWRNTTGDSNYP
jgi:hypothetical protein